MGNNPQKELTSLEAYKAMFSFLDAYWKRSGKNSEELAALLGSMALLPDGNSADPAQMEDWKKAVEQALSEGK
jgi:hypothetical protein